MAPSNDLPDVMQADNAVGTSGADDLLAQLAGDEIDRLLTEAEARVTEEAVAVEQVETALPEAAPLQAVEVPAVAVMEAASPAAETAASQDVTAGVTAEEAVATADSAIASQLDALFQELTQETGAAAPIEQANAPAAAPEAQATINVPSAETAGEVVEESGEVEEEKVPLLLRPLIWINLPFGFLSENARRSIGWAAIVTLVNASILLAATYIFKKH